MKTRTMFALALLFALAGPSCKKDRTTELQGDWLFPIAKGSFSLNSLSIFRHFGYRMEVQPADIKQPVGVPVSSSGLYFPYLGPGEVPLADCIQRLDVDTLSFSGTLTNSFPIAMGAGTRLVIRTAADTTTSTTIAGFATLDKDLPPGGTFSFSVLVHNNVLGDHLYLYLENFSTPAFRNISFPAAPATLDVHIDVVTAHYAEIITGCECRSEDTSEFSAASEHGNASQTSGTVSDTAISGVINVFSQNSLPVAARMQLYFLNMDKTRVIDSLFYPAPYEVERGRTNGQGEPIYTASDSGKVAISRNKLERIKQAAYVKSQLYLSTVGQTGAAVSANEHAALQVQFTGDLRLNIRF